MGEQQVRKKKWANIWYYYKVHIIATFCGLLLLTIFIWQRYSREQYDYAVAFTGTENLTFEEQEELIGLLEKYGKDRNGDGEVNIQYHSYIFEEGELIDPNRALAEQTRFIGDLENGISMIYLYSDAIYEDFKNEEIFPKEASKRFYLRDMPGGISEDFSSLQISLINIERVDHNDKEEIQTYYRDSQQLIEQLREN